MGNTVGREQDINRRPRGLSASSATIARNVPLPFVQPSSSRSLRNRERERQREEHAWNLVVRYEETVDGGYLAPYGTYKSNLDYKTEIVRSLIVDRKLAPFFTPLQDFDSDWTDDELINVLDKLPLHAELITNPDDEEEDMDSHKIPKSHSSQKKLESKQSKARVKLKLLKWQEDAEQKYLRDRQVLPPRRNPLLPSRDFQLKLYRDAQECPICFVYYPPYLNISRCCIQPICSECFVQIKRLDPHPPHDEHGNETETENPEDLISESAKCPFCASPDFGVTYYPPNFKVGLEGSYPSHYKNNDTTTINEDELGSTSPTSISDAINKTRSAVGTPPRHSSSSTRLPRESMSSNSTTSVLLDVEDNRTRRKRQGSLPPNTPGVITTDFIRPDWESKLKSSRLRLARRSAAATVIHANNLLYNEPEDQHQQQHHHRHHTNTDNQLQPASHRSSSSMIRSKSDTDELEERMIEEALRLSLLEQDSKDTSKDSLK